MKRPTRDDPRERGRGHTTMERRKFLIGAGALASGSAAAVGTGAFTSVSADRSVDIDVADDPNALLGIDASNASNGDYVVGTSNGAAVDISESNSNIMGEGVNENATTVLRDLFDIRNQGGSGVFVYVNTGVDGFGFFSDYPANVEYDADNPVGQPEPGPGGPTTGIAKEGQVVDAGTDGLPGDGDYGFSEGIQSSIPARVYLEPGESLREVGFVINTQGGFGSDAPIDTTVTIGANSVDTLGEDVSVNTDIGANWEVDVSGFDAT